MKQTDSIIQNAMGRLMGMQDYGDRNQMNQHMSHLKIDGNHYEGSYNQHRGANQTPMPSRFRHLMNSG
eukprot:CAMPEP_0205834698 /NCGR_PEP_ID=MMETSP0206-20130828/50932_1 /ASSEMBLY_ACC=CAM_ASM_000279 /TAXON_ID=36767 /ORGANISM="Euplotes focardii, Strain TN1" /LENGTH=67 /DNA_ID=CAMNT_0053141789 /DNA_START=560 /DNA_END=763 /DNA_ORIENTATION=-